MRAQSAIIIKARLHDYAILPEIEACLSPENVGFDFVTSGTIACANMLGKLRRIVLMFEGTKAQRYFLLPKLTTRPASHTGHCYRTDVIYQGLQ